MLTRKISEAKRFIFSKHCIYDGLTYTYQLASWPPFNGNIYYLEPGQRLLQSFHVLHQDLSDHLMLRKN